MRIFCTLICVLFFVQSCGDYSGRDAGAKSSSCSPQVEKTLEFSKDQSLLLFSATDVTFASSSLYTLDVDTSEIKTVLSGQSGDLYVKRIGSLIFVINRKQGENNIRLLRLKSKDDESTNLEIGRTCPLPGVFAGDPHDIALLDEKHALLASYVGPQLAILDLETLKLSAAEDLNFGLTAKAPLRFESLRRLDDGRILAVRQGFSSTYEIDGTQTAQIFSFKNGKLSAQSIKLKGSAPVGVFAQGDDTFATLSICSPVYKKCKSSLDLIDTKSLSVKSVEIPSHYEFYGSTVADEDAGMLYASVKNKAGKTVVTKINASTGATTEVYSYPRGTYSGYWGMFADPVSKRILIGNSLSMSTGELSVLTNHKVSKTVDLPAIPFSGVMLNGSGQ